MADRDNKAPGKGAPQTANTPHREDHAHHGGGNVQRITEWRREFQQLTGINPALLSDQERLMAWQKQNGLVPTGKVRAADIKKARELASPRQDAAADDEGIDGEVLGNPALTDNITDGAKGLGKAPNDSLGTALEGAGDMPSSLVDASNAARVAGGELVSGSGATLLTEGEEGIELPWLKFANTPAILNLIKEEKYGDAAILLARQFAPSQVVEALVFASKKVGVRAFVELFEGLAKIGTQLDIGMMGFLWVWDGIQAVQRAHEEGDKKSRIRMYAFAFADAFLYGEGADGGRARAVTAEQHEAVELGLKDGSRTAGQFGAAAPDIARELLRRYEHDEGALRRAIMDQLAKRAGLSSVWS